MACQTFLKIAQSCKSEFVVLQKKSDEFYNDRFVLEQEPYVYELIRRIPEETIQLNNNHKLIFHEALGKKYL